MPQAPKVWFRPLLLNTVTGSWCNLLRVRQSGVLSRHVHPSWVTGYVIRGAWRYLEHDWVAREGSFVYEPPGEIHTLVVDEAAGGATEMITFFNIHGAMVYVDEAGQTTGYEDVFTKIAMCKAHYRPWAWARTTSTSSCADQPGASPAACARLFGRQRAQHHLALRPRHLDAGFGQAVADLHRQLGAHLHPVGEVLGPGAHVELQLAGAQPGHDARPAPAWRPRRCTSARSPPAGPSCAAGRRV